MYPQQLQQAPMNTSNPAGTQLAQVKLKGSQNKTKSWTWERAWYGGRRFIVAGTREVSIFKIHYKHMKSPKDKIYQFLKRNSINSIALEFWK